MGSEKKQYRFRIDEETRQYIDDFAEDNNMPYVGHALERIISEHKELSKQNWNLQYISDTVAENVTKSVQIALQKSIANEINKVRLGVASGKCGFTTLRKSKHKKPNFSVL